MCLKKGIERKFIVRHIGKKHRAYIGDATQILELPRHPLIENWVEKVLEVQGRALQKIEEKLRTPEKSTTSDEQPEEQSPTNNKSDVDDPLKKFKCPHCPYRTKYLGDLRKHERRHLSHKPLKCGHCDYEACLNHEIASHTKYRHKGLPVLVVTNPAPTNTTLTPIVRRKRRRKNAAASNAAPPSVDIDDDADVMSVEEDADGAAKCDGKEEEEDDGGDDSVGSLLRQKLEGNLKKYKCRICEHTSDSFLYMRQDHVRSHFKPFECPHCKKR